MDTTQWYKWDAANAMRVVCVHHGYSPPSQKARTVVNTYWRTYRECLEALLCNTGGSTIDRVRGSINVVTQALGQPPSNCLSDLTLAFAVGRHRR